MKRLASFILFAAGTFSSFAVVSVNWSTPAGSIKQSGGVADAPRTWFAQLIWSPDNVPSALDSNSPFVPTGGEIVMASQALSPIVPANGRILTSAAVTGSDSLAGGFVYTRVFNVDFSGSPATPTLYGNSSVVSGSLVVATTDPGTTLAHWSTPSGVGLVVNQAVAVVPEPSTYAFLGVGAMVFGMRRLRVRR